MMRWSADAARGEEVSESPQRLLQSLWNPKGDARLGGWRMDMGDLQSLASHMTQ